MSPQTLAALHRCREIAGQYYEAAHIVGINADVMTDRITSPLIEKTERLERELAQMQRRYQWVRTAAQLRAWMRKHGYTIARLSEELDISPRQINYYRSEAWEIPRVVALACQALSSGDISRSLKARSR